jgi:hypothetical protein
LTSDDTAVCSDFKVVDPVVGNLLPVDYNLVKTLNKRPDQDIRGCDVLVSISSMSRLEIPAGGHALKAGMPIDRARPMRLRPVSM